MEAWQDVPLIVARSGACLPFLLCLHHSLRSALTDRMTGVPLLIYLMQCFEVPLCAEGITLCGSPGCPASRLPSVSCCSTSA